MGDNITVFKIQTLNSQPQNPIHTISSSFSLSFFFLFSLFFFLSSSAEKRREFCFFFKEFQKFSENSALKTLFTQLECLLWISEGDSFLLRFIPLFIEEKLALLTYAMSSA
ncbi:MAG: hypothetical protein K6253_01830, partial [Candidatus Liberibacter asiaticus]|nr:hypothetical protein [Candidatus Liberibacter asiaticus]